MDIQRCCVCHHLRLLSCPNPCEFGGVFSPHPNQEELNFYFLLSPRYPYGYLGDCLRQHPNIQARRQYLNRLLLEVQFDEVNVHGGVATFIQQQQQQIQLLTARVTNLHGVVQNMREASQNDIVAINGFRDLVHARRAEELEDENSMQTRAQNIDNRLQQVQAQVNGIMGDQEQQNQHANIMHILEHPMQFHGPEIDLNNPPF